MIDQNIMAKQLLIKQSAENIKYTFDFTKRIAAGVTIDSVVITSATSGGDTSDLTITSGSISGRTVTFFIDGGTNAVSYKIDVAVEISTGESLIGSGMLKIINS